MDAPPTYEQATGSTTASGRLQPLSTEQRQRVREESRPLPEGWIRCFDPSNEHTFYVDTRPDPPRSIWVHPHDDADYLATLTSEQRERIQDEAQRQNRNDLVDDSTDDEDPHGYPKDRKTRVDEKRAPAPAAAAASSSSAAGPGPSSAAAAAAQPRKAKASFGRSLKDKLTGTTHEQRVRERKQRMEEEARIYHQQEQLRRAMQMALHTGQPQYVGKDNNGTDVYVEPPGRVIPDARNMNFLSPHALSGMYGPGSPGPTGARFIQPEARFSRPYGSGFGGGGGSMALPVAGGLAGGLLLGSLLF